jgi:uncharacterized protein with FMN-binding domain
MKKILIIICIIILSTIIIGSIAYNKINKNLQSLEDIKVSTIDLGLLDDGVYQGSYAVFPVKVKVEVDIKDHKIENIKIIEHDNGKGKAAEEIIETIKERQTIDVDIIAGATYSSRVIQKAIEVALLKK